MVDRARWARSPTRCRSASAGVSILVVVDRARWGPICPGRPRRPQRFQSLLWWIGLAGRSRRRATGECDGGFQSLLWWIGLAGVGPRSPRSPPTRSFNPCCGGSGSLGCLVATRPWRERRFNPCCGGSGSLGSQAQRSCISCAIRFQSLLWWIGLAGEPIDHGRPWTGCVGFNPCCGGSGSLGSDRRSAVDSESCVSILVVVDRARWERAETPDPAPERSFNPCCGGSGSLGRRRRESFGLRLQFQSLLWWIGLAGVGESAQVAVFGLVSILVVVDRARWGPIGFQDSDPSFRFQSLLWWIGLAGLAAPLGFGCGSRLFQSLLWWIGLAGAKRRSRVGRLRSVFQSLLWWIGLAGTRVARARRRIRCDVSILVVVDRARWADRRSATLASRCSFNPCCGGSGSLGSSGRFG